MTLPEILEWLAARDGGLAFRRVPGGGVEVTLKVNLPGAAYDHRKTLPPTAGGYLLMVTVADLYKEVRAAAGEGKP